MNLLRRTGSASSLLWRSLPFVACTLGTMASLLWRQGRAGATRSRSCSALAALGIADLQPRRAVLRNYPIIGPALYLLEHPAGDPLSTCSRPTTSCRSRAALAGIPASGQTTRAEGLRHARRRLPCRPRVRRYSMRPAPEADPAASASRSGVRIARGRTRPRSSTSSALSFGALSANAILSPEPRRARALRPRPPARAASARTTSTHGNDPSGRSAAAALRLPHRG